MIQPIFFSRRLKIFLIIGLAIITCSDRLAANPVHPGWSYNFTGSNATVLFDPSGNYFAGGFPIAAGDYIGVFYNFQGGFACGGYVAWPATYISIWGAAEPPLYGFATNELIKWRIWKKATNTVYEVTPTYVLTPPFTISGNYSTNSFGKISNLTDNSSPASLATLDIPEGWSLFSLEQIPASQNPAIFFSGQNQLLQVKNQAGQIYSPSPAVNSIGSLSLSQGYKILSNSSFSKTYSGQPYLPENNPISLAAGWNLVGYPRTSPAGVSTLFSSLLADIVMIKSGEGAIYAPAWGVQTLSQFQPGKGYWVYMSNPNTLTYPAN